MSTLKDFFEFGYFWSKHKDSVYSKKLPNRWRDLLTVEYVDLGEPNMSRGDGI